MLFLWIFGDNVEDYFGHVGICSSILCRDRVGLMHVLFN